MASTYVIEIHTLQQREAIDCDTLEQAVKAAGDVAKRFHCNEVIPLSECDCLRPDNIMIAARSNNVTIMIVRYDV